MKVYILYLSCKTMEDIVGVYDSMEKAKKAFSDLAVHFTGTSCVNLYIIEREVM